MRRKPDESAHRLPIRFTTGYARFDGLDHGEKTMARDPKPVAEQRALAPLSSDARAVLQC